MLIILGMFLVTYIPRLIPVFIVERVTLPKWLEKWLICIPYAALSALIFPSILAIDENPYVGVIGGLVAIVAAYLRVHIIFVIFISILTVIIIS